MSDVAGLELERSKALRVAMVTAHCLPFMGGIAQNPRDGPQIAAQAHAFLRLLTRSIMGLRLLSDTGHDFVTVRVLHSPSRLRRSSGVATYTSTKVTASARCFAHGQPFGWTRRD